MASEPGVTPGTPLTPLQRRLAYTASRRSILEVEQLLERFLRHHLHHLDDAQCAALQDLLDRHTDLDLLDWLAGARVVPETVDPALLRLLVADAGAGAGRESL